MNAAELHAAALSGDWVWPYWREQQLSGGGVAVGDNETARNWTTLGNLASDRKAIVDQRGLVSPCPAGWSLDWWVGADDRWHFPSRDAGVRQRLVGDSPVVRTAMRVPGGDAVHRAYAARAPSGYGVDELVVIEIQNHTSLPFVIAFAVRPYNPAGLSDIGQIEVSGGRVAVNGRSGLLLPGPPRRAAGSTFEQGDSAGVVERGQAGDALPRPLRCRRGMAQAAFLYPLAHTAVMRVAMPLDQPPPRTRRRRDHRPAARPAPSALPARPALPSAEEVARGWQAQSRRGMRLELPAGRLASAVAANRRYLLLMQPGRGEASRVAALDHHGFHFEADEALGAWAAGRRIDGDAHMTFLWALAQHWRLTGDTDIVQRLAPLIGKCVRWIERSRDKSRDPLWSLRGLRDGTDLLAGAGEDRAAATAASSASGMRRDIEAYLAAMAERLDTSDLTAAIGSLAACSPLQLVLGATLGFGAIVDVIRERLREREALSLPLDTLASLRLAAVELEAADRRALGRLQWLLDVATPTWTWPAFIDPRRGSGCGGEGHHGGVAAELCSLVRNLLVQEVPGGLALLTLLPDEWLGLPIEVHDAPTHAGLLSYAIRWHGERPALLWELRRREGVAPVRLTIPGLDRRWRSLQAAGETLLAPVDRTVAGDGGLS